MKALCVKQPWAELIASGRKTTEMRTWTTKYRGPVLILASAQRARTPDAVEWDEIEGEQGVAICIVELVSIGPVNRDDYMPSACCHVDRGEFGWELANVYRVPPVPVKGRLGLFEVPQEIVHAIGDHPETSLPVLEAMINTLAA